jgi:energy-coupling factor transport system substrate-specific component
MVVLTALSAALYVAALLPFKVAVIIPGLTEVRPGAAVPILLSFLFGPAAAFGSGFGNLIADVLGGMFGPASVFGFIGNFLYGYVPYSLWRAIRGAARPGEKGAADWALIIAIVIISCLTVSVFIGWGVDLLGLAPFAALGNIIFINNLITSLALAIPLLALTYARIEKAGLIWNSIMDESDMGAGRWRKAGFVIVTAASIAAMIVGDAVSLGFLNVGFGAAGFGGAKGALAVSGGMAPFIFAILIGCALL